MMEALNYPRVCVLLAAYNGMQFVSKQVTSILSQREVDVVIWASVDLSSDGTESWFDCLSNSDPRVMVLSHGSRFGNAAKNFFRLLRNVDFNKYDYVAFADQDDIWNIDKLARAIRVLNANGASCYSSNVIAFWEDGREVLIDKAQSQREWDFLFESAGPGCTYVFRRNFVTDLQSFIINNFYFLSDIELHDWFVYAYARKNNYFWVIDDYCSMRYRQHSHNEFGANHGFFAFIIRAKKFFNGWIFSQASNTARLIGVCDDPWVIHWLDRGRLGTLWLAFHATQCRRRPRDQILFALACLIYAVFGGLFA